MQRTIWLVVRLGLMATLLSSFTTVQALDDPCGCSAGLAPLVVQHSSSDYLKLAFLKQIDEQQYEKVKKGGSIGIEIFEMFGVNLSYNQFDERRRQYLEKQKFALSREKSQSFVLSTVQTGDWGKCMQACIDSQRSFYCGIAALTKSVVALRCSWRPEGGTAINERKVTVVVDSTEVGSKSVPVNTQRDWQFPRNPSKDMLITFTPEGASSSTIEVAATPVEPPPPSPKPVAIGSCVGDGGLKNVQFWGPVGEACNGISSWGQYLVNTTSTPPTEMCSCIGHGGPEGVRLWGPKGSVCGGIPKWLTYSEKCVSIDTLEVCGCTGRGNILSGHVLWGPRGENCGGMDDPQWGTYNQYCIGPK